MKSPLTVGSALPRVGAEGLWIGNLAMWLPTLNRFVDPTIYQVNVAGRREQIKMGVVLHLSSKATIDGIRCEKNGAVIRYWMVDDPEQSWRIRLTPATERLIDQWSHVVHRGVVNWLRDDAKGRQLAAALTDPGIVNVAAPGNPPECDLTGPGSRGSASQAAHHYGPPYRRRRHFSAE